MNGSDWTLTDDVVLNKGGGAGVVNINSGVLSINGSLEAPGGVNALGGMLAGEGALLAATFIGEGVIAPGNSIGTLAFTGDLTLGAGSIYEIEVDGGTADLILVRPRLSFRWEPRLMWLINLFWRRQASGGDLHQRHRSSGTCRRQG